MAAPNERLQEKIMLGGNKYPKTNEKCWTGSMRKDTSNIVSASNKAPFSAKKDPKKMNNRAGQK